MVKYFLSMDVEKEVFFEFSVLTTLIAFFFQCYILLSLLPSCFFSLPALG